ncbi:gamma-glutamylcyclotransferase family protein [Acidicapsa acidisoli]|uniref:gamma-glutamylcyclotransferase family protein n=1 Tax=Acidicapsa acidisoli TaxID=1615681 RepID=UPI0021E0BC87|nr:gamma-glutamylcyclotransferase family protein [Acidicapsa acidisoli]
MASYLFTYGTLQPGLAPDCIAHAVNKLRSIGESSIHGELYDLGEYPGAVLNPRSRHQIHGMVFLLPEDANILRQFDDYEGFQIDSPETSLFLRELHPVVLTATGQTLPCWVYVYNGKPDPVRILPNGRFLG